MGCYYIDYLMEMYGGNVKCELEAYKAGLSNVDKWLENRDVYKRQELRHAFGTAEL